MKNTEAIKKKKVIEKIFSLINVSLYIIIGLAVVGLFNKIDISLIKGICFLIIMVDLIILFWCSFLEKKLYNQPHFEIGDTIFYKVLPTNEKITYKVQSLGEKNLVLINDKGKNIDLLFKDQDFFELEN